MIIFILFKVINIYKKNLKLFKNVNYYFIKLFHYRIQKNLILILKL